MSILRVEEITKLDGSPFFPDLSPFLLKEIVGTGSPLFANKGFLYLLYDANLVYLPIGNDGDRVAFSDLRSEFGIKPVTLIAQSGQTVAGSTSISLTKDNRAIGLVFQENNWVTVWSYGGDDAEGTPELQATLVSTSSLAASAGRLYLLNGTTSVTLPVGVNNDRIAFADFAQRFGQAGFSVNITPSALQTIAGASVYTLNRTNDYVEFVFRNDRWVFTESSLRQAIEDGSVLLTGFTFPNQGLKVRDNSDSGDTLTLSSGEELTANRTLDFVVGDANRTLTVGEDASVSGTNTGDQTVSITGDVTADPSQGELVATIADGAVTFAKMQIIGERTLVARTAAGTGAATDIPFGTLVDEISGTAIGELVRIEDVGGSPALPPLDASQLSNLPISELTVDTTGFVVNTETALQDHLAYNDDYLADRLSTGLSFGGVITIDAGTATFSVTAGHGYIGGTKVSWLAGSTLAHAGNGQNWVYVDSLGAIQISTTEPTGAELRSRIYLSRLSVTGGLITGILHLPTLTQQSEASLKELGDVLGPRRNHPTDLLISAVAGTLQLYISAGGLFKLGSNHDDTTAPNLISYGVFSGGTFQHRLKDNTNLGDTTILDVGFYAPAGVRTVIPGASTRIGVYYVWRFPGDAGNVRVTYSNNFYNNTSEALTALNYLAALSNAPTSFVDAFLLGAIVALKNETNLGNATFVETNASGQFSGGSIASLSGTATFQTVYDNSVDPEVLTNVTKGSVDIRAGLGLDATNVLTAQNNAGTVTFSVTGNGLVTATNLTVTNTITGSISGNAATVTNGVYTTGSYSNPAWITSLAWNKITGAPETVVFILTPEEVDIVVDTSIMGLNAFPYAMVISSVRLDIAVAPTGSAVIVDMLKNGVSMMSTKFSIDPSEFSSTTAAAPPVLSSTSIALGDKITFKVDQRGATVPGQFLTVTIDGARI